MKKISIIVPVYNSAQSLENLNREIDTYFENSQYDIEKIFVNDSSSDNSWDLLQILRDKSFTQASSCDSRMKIISLKSNTGQQNALFCGMHYASGDFILTIDDDLQHDIAYVGKMLEMLENGYDLVYGVHAIVHEDIRSYGSKLTAYFFKKTFPALDGMRVSSFRVFKRNLLEKLLQCPYAFIYISALLLRQNPKVGNINISKRNRSCGESGYNLRKLVILFVKLVWFYGNYVPEFLKKMGDAYEEIDDARCGQLSAKCH